MNIFVKILQSSLTPFLLLAISPAFAETHPVDISGNYICSGKDTSDNSQYTVDLTITKSGDLYQYKGVEKGIDNKTQIFLGTVLFAENSNSIFAAEFWQDNDPSKSGLIVNQIQADGGWKGIWTWRDKPGVNMEECKKKSSY